MDVRVGEVVALFQCRGANAGVVRLNCPLTACRVGELSPVVDAGELGKSELVPVPTPAPASPRESPRPSP